MTKRVAVFQLAIALAVGALAHAQQQSQEKPRVVHVFVALADNQHQGIVPVPAALGNGDDPSRNLYWGAAFGLHTFFRKSADWKEILVVKAPYRGVLQRTVFRHRAENAFLVADAYRGIEIKQSISDFLRSSAGIDVHAGEPKACTVGGLVWCPPDDADVLVYIGHDGLMDFSLAPDFSARSKERRQSIILACASKPYFADLLRSSGAEPLLWTTGLMAPEAYTLEAALQGWILRESKEQIRRRAAAAYAKYQRCGENAALRLFATGW